MTSKNVTSTAGVVLLTVLALVVALSAKTQTLTVLYNFTGPNGTYPHGPLLFDQAGNLYGTIRQPTAQTNLQTAGVNGGGLALAAARECNPARRGGHAAGYGASTSRAFVFRNYPRDLLAFDPRRRAGSSAKGRGFAYATQVDPSCRNRENG